MTKNQIPRWLSEGVSVYEEKSGRPEWGRRQDIELIKAVQENRIIGLNQLDAGFSQAKTLAELNFAYYEASLLIEFIVERYGFETLKTTYLPVCGPTRRRALFSDRFLMSPWKNLSANFFSWINERVNMLNVYVAKDGSSDLAHFLFKRTTKTCRRRRSSKTHGLKPCASK